MIIPNPFRERVERGLSRGGHFIAELVDLMDPGLELCQALRQRKAQALMEAYPRLAMAVSNLSGRGSHTPSAEEIERACLIARRSACDMIGRGFDPRAIDARGRPPLHSAIDRNDHEAALALLCAGADPDQGDAHEINALHKAIHAQLPRHAFLLLALGADPNAWCLSGSPLSLAIRKMNSHHCADLAFELMALGADTSHVDEHGDPLLHSAIYYGENQIALALLDLPGAGRSRDSEGRSALAIAIAEDSESMVQELLRRGLGLWDRDRSGRDALANAELALAHDPGHGDYRPLIIAAREALALREASSPAPRALGPSRL